MLVNVLALKRASMLPSTVSVFRCAACHDVRTSPVPFTGWESTRNVSNCCNRSYPLSYGVFTLIGGQHVGKAVQMWPEEPTCRWNGTPRSRLPPWLREVTAQVLENGTPPDVCAAAASRHQRQHMRTTTSTTSQWCRHFCTRLAHIKVTDGINFLVLH